MQGYVSAFVGVCLMAALAATGRTQDRSAAKAIIEKAIQAAGGAARLTKFKAGTYKSKGTLYGMGAGDLSFTQETAVQFPEHWRTTFSSDILRKTIVLNGAKGWIRQDDQTQELIEDALASQQDVLYTSWIASLAPLTGKGFTLTALGDSKVGDRPVEGVNVARKGHADVKLYFDKKSSLLLKMEHPIKGNLTGEETKQETLFSKFKEIDGIEEPMKVIFKLNGGLVAEEEILELKHFEKLDAKLFAKP
jgi:hypothetical protein